MNHKYKIVLIAVELFVLLVLLLLGVGCQQRWFIVTDEGPRFDWYTLVETTPPTDSKPTDDTQQEPADDPAEDEPEPTATSQPTQSTWQPAAPSAEPEDTTGPDASTSESTEDTTESGDEFPMIPLG